MSKYLGNEDLDVKEYSFDYSNADEGSGFRELNPDDIGGLLERALASIDSAHYDSALADLNEAIFMIPDYAYSYFYRGVAYLGKEDYKQAEADFLKTLELEPLAAPAYNNLGLMYLWQEKFITAKTYFEKAIAVDPEYAAPHYLLGNMYLSQDKTKWAIREYNKCLEINPEFYEVHYSKGLIYYLDEKWKKAIASFSLALPGVEDPSSVFLLRGISYALSKQVPAALTDWKRGIEIDSTAGYFHILIGYTLLEDKQYEEALIQFSIGTRKTPTEVSNRTLNSRRLTRQLELETAIHLYETDIESVSEESKDELTAALIAFYKKDYSKTQKLLSKVFLSHGALSSAYYLSGLCNDYQNESKAAYEDFKRVAEINPNLFEIYRKMAEYELANNILNASIVSCSQMIRLEPDNSIAYQIRGQIWIDNNRFKNAYLDFTESIKRDSSNWKAWDKRGNALMQLGNVEASLSDLERVNEAQPYNYLYLIDYSDALLASGDTTRCLRKLSLFLEEFPNNVDVLLRRSYVNIISGNYQLSLEDISHLNQIGYNPPSLRCRKALCYYGLKKYERTIEICEDVIKSKYQGSMGEAYFFKALATYQSGNTGLACSFLLEARKYGYSVEDAVYDDMCQ